MALSVGIDLERIDRVARLLGRHPERFLSRHFTPREVAYCAGDPARLGARWAAKEAVAKALGTGLGAVAFHEIEIVTGSEGAPSLSLHGAASARADALGLRVWSLSLSHTAEHATAVAVAMG